MTARRGRPPARAATRPRRSAGRTWPASFLRGPGRGPHSDRYRSFGRPTAPLSSNGGRSRAPVTSGDTGRARGFRLTPRDLRELRQLLADRRDLVIAAPLREHVAERVEELE